jgi:Polysaccharide biosynthesis protein.
MMKALGTKIAGGAKALKTVLTRKSQVIVSFVFTIVMCLLVLIQSGFGVTTLQNLSTVRKIGYLVIFVILFLAYVLFFDVSWFKSKQAILDKLKQPDRLFIYCLIFGLGIGLSFIMNQAKTDNLYTYLDIAAVFITSFLFVKVVSFDRFVKVYCTFLACCCFMSLFLSIATIFSGVGFSTSIFRIEGYYYDNFLGINLFYGENEFLNYNNFRIMSLFWEPGVFASYLLIALVFQLVFRDKPNYWLCLLYSICILLTASTAGIFLFVLIIALLFSKILSKKKALIGQLIILTLVVVSIACSTWIFGWLAKIFPLVFSKLVDKNGSFQTRLLSPYYYFLVFLKSPWFGFGGVTANELYFSLAPSSVNARTSTSGLLLASFGVIGFLYTLVPIFYLLANKKLPVINRIVLAVLFFGLINKENHSGLLVSNLVLFYLIQACPPLRKAAVSSVTTKPTTVAAFLFTANEKGKFSMDFSLSFIVKGLSLVAAFLTLPAYTRYFSNDDILGVWLAIVSFLTYIISCDFGLGNGMKNKLIEARSKHDSVLEKKYISAGYLSSGVFSLVLATGLLIAVWLVDLNSLFAVSETVISPLILKWSMSVVILSVCLELFLKNIVFILQSFQKNALASFITFLSTCLLLVFAYTYKGFLPLNDLIVFSMWHFLSVNLPLIVTSIVVFAKKIEPFPSFSAVEWKTTASLFSLGIRFFILQITTMVLFGINDIFISNLYGPSVVVVYQKYFKIFNAIIGLATIVQSPIWVAVAKAVQDKRFDRIKKLFYLDCAFTGLLVIIAGVAALGLQVIFDLWLGQYTIQVVPWISLAFFLFSLIYLLVSLVTPFMNGTEAFKTFTIVSLVACILKVPAIFLFKMWLGDSSWVFVVVVNAILISPALVLTPIEIIKKLKGGKTHAKNKMA